MQRSQIFSMACALALMAGCAHNKNSKMASAQSSQDVTSTGETSAAPAPAVDPDSLKGSWTLAAPRQQQQGASITAAEGTHVNLDAGNLSGEYVVQGNYLLILTRDERLRPLAWRINSADSLTCVRSADMGDGKDYTGVTLVRSADESNSTFTETDTSELAPDEQ
jgi:hypothetical protein